MTSSAAQLGTQLEPDRPKRDQDSDQNKASQTVGGVWARRRGESAGERTTSEEGLDRVFAVYSSSARNQMARGGGACPPMPAVCAAPHAK